MPTLAVFPWVTLNEPQTYGEFQLMPYERGARPCRDAESQAGVDSVLARYYSTASASVTKATLVSHGDRDVTDDLSEDEIAHYVVFAELFAFAALSARTYFGQFGYSNRDQFEFVVQRFRPETGTVAIVSRRRDGTTMSGFTEGTVLWQRPPHVSGGAPDVDDALLRALLTARADTGWDRWYEAIVGFNLANTDHPKMSPAIEAVLVVGALQRLLSCRGSDVNELCGRFNQLFRPTGRKAVADCGVTSQDQGVTDRLRRAVSVSDGWLRDFYALRGNLAHGMTSPRYPSIWNVHEHLLLSAFLFPLLVKLVLAEAGIYTLTDTDQADIDLFEELACERHLVERDARDDRRWPWTNIRSPMRIALKAAVRRSAERGQ